MGEAKKKREREAKMTDFERLIEGTMKKLADDGKLIEAGWVSLRKVWFPEDAPPEQIKDLRWAYMAGAQHVFSSLLVIMDEDRDPTPADLRKMELIHNELEAFRIEMEMSLPAEGNA